MKRWAPLAIIVLAGVTAILAVQWKQLSTRPSADAILSAGADVQHEFTRIPAHIGPMSDADEIAAGNALADSYSATWRLSTDSDHAQEAHITSVGMALATHARRKLPWHFHYIPDRQFVNAFALPGGQIFVGRGLLELMHSEDALAAVIGHEIEQVDLRHCAERPRPSPNFAALARSAPWLAFPSRCSWRATARTKSSKPTATARVSP